MALRLRGATSGYIELKAPASAGDNTLTLPTNNGGANQLLKIDGSGNLSWQSNLTFDGSTLTVTGAVGISNDLFHIGDDDTKITFTDNQIDLRTGNLSRIYLNNYALYVRSGFPFAFLASSGDSPNIKSGGTNAQDLLLTTGSGNPTRLQVGVGGDVTVNTGNLVIGTAGKGIDFSINSDGSRTVTTNGNLFHDYEEGTFNAQLGGATNHGTHEISGGGTYTKIGRKVYMQISFQNSDLNDNAAGQILIKNLPFTFVDSTVNSSHVCAGVSCDFATTNVTYPHSGDMNRYAWQLIASAGHIKGYRINDGGGMTDWDASHWVASSMELRLNISSLTAT